MSDDSSVVELLFVPPSDDLSDVEMIPETASRAPSEHTSAELSRLTSLSLADGKPRPYVEVSTLPPEVKAKYSGLAELPVPSDDEFPEGMECVLGEYVASNGLQYFVKMSNGTAYKVSRLLSRSLTRN